MRKRITGVIVVLTILSSFLTAKAAKNMGYMWPTPGYGTINRGLISGSHYGIDIGAPLGADVYASKSGTIIKKYTGCNNYSKNQGTCKSGGICNPNHGYYSDGICNDDFGNGYIIKHDDGTWTEYAHMNYLSDSLYEGGYVTQGTFLGKVNSTGNSSGPHLHFGLRQGGSSFWSATVLNPLDYMDTDDRGNVAKTPVDLGTNFYAYIFNQPCWKTVACDTNGYNVFLETEKWTANQRWYCTRNDDGSYTFKNAANNRCLDVENAGTSNGTNVQAVGSNGNDAQKWFIYAMNGYYVISPKCAPGKVLDLYSGYTDDGTNVQIYDENDSNAQVFTLYPVEADAGKPGIKSNVEIMKTDGTATISWNSTEYTDHYIYFLTEYPEGYGYTTNTAHGDILGTSVNFSNLTSGKYSCFIHAVSHQNKWGAQSNWVSFNVYADDYIPTKTVVYNNHIYALYDYEMSWSFARDLCADLGGNLVTITSADENQVITDLIQSGSKAAYWLGATDIDDTDKNYRWITGENFSYSNWNSGEPSSSGEDGEKEHFAEVRKSYGNKWNDVNNISKSNKGFILEIEIADYPPATTETYNGNQYMVFDKNTTWSEAEVFCEQLGGHLVTLESTDEQAFVQTLLKRGDRAWYYIGGQKDNGTWKWYDGRTAEYVPLADNAAQWDGTNLMMYKSTGQCVGLQNAYYPEKDISHIGFVCEFEKQTEPIPPQPSGMPTFSLSQHDGYVEIVNDSEIEYTPEIIIAMYENGRLTDVSSTSITFAAGEKRNISIDSGDIKVFVWNSLKDMVPLAYPK